MPRATTLQKIADYFGVSVAYLKGDDDLPLPPPSAPVFHRDGQGSAVELDPPADEPSPPLVTLFDDGALHIRHRDGSESDKTISHEHVDVLHKMAEAMPEKEEKDI